MSKREVWHPADYDAADVRAIQSLALYATAAERQYPEGQEPPPPSPVEVKRALDWIIYKAAQTYDDPFKPGQPDVRDYVLGRASVGKQIVKLMQLKPEVIGGG